MSANNLSPAFRRFVDYFGELGARWGLPAEACRVHAFLYLVPGPSSETDLTSALDLDDAALAEATAFLVDYQLVRRVGASGWQTSGDPWDMLARGLEQRRRRELPPALSTLRDCHSDAVSDDQIDPRSVRQIAKMLELFEDLAAIDSRTRNLSPHLLRGLVGLSGRASRFLDRALGPGKRGRL